MLPEVDTLTAEPLERGGTNQVEKRLNPPKGGLNRVFSSLQEKLKTLSTASVLIQKPVAELAIHGSFVARTQEALPAQPERRGRSYAAISESDHSSA